ncbi:MAG: c-type cytochrome [Gammaproteobacteria bacterium]
MSTDTIKSRKSGALVLIPALALMLLGAGCSDKETTSSQQVTPAEAPAPQTAKPEAMPPVKAPEPAAEAPAGTGMAAAGGEKIYQSSCHACHAAGVAGAPKLGDKAAWAPRIAKGNDALLSSVKNGLNAMPPKGACMSCSDDDLRSAVDYMVGQGS